MTAKGCTLVGRIASTVVGVVGAVTLLKFVWDVAWLAKNASGLFWSRDLYQRYGKFGKWAVITGGSDGIGKAMAKELARQGFNIVLISNRVEQLQEAAAEVSAAAAAADVGAQKQHRNPIEIRTIEFDFADTDETRYMAMLQQLPSADDGGIAILVNNVGVSRPIPAGLEAYPCEEDVRLLHINCYAPLRMNKFVIPVLKRQGGGAIVHLSSISGVFGRIPFQTAYAASKAFVRVLSRSVELELREHNIDVLTVTPSFVSTAMTQGVAPSRPPLSFQMVAVDEMARDTLAALGNVVETHGHRNHWWLHYYRFQLLPGSYVEHGILSIMKMRMQMVERMRSQQQPK